MFRIAIVFGLISGAIGIGALMAGLLLSDFQGFFATEWFGYLMLILSSSMIFFGVKRYRDTESGGVVKFLPALLMGLSIAVVAGIVYVAVWETYLASTGYAFMNAYADMVIEGARAAGVSGAALDSQIAAMEELKRQYANPLFRLPMTFMEIFPVGAVIALVSAVVLINPRVLPARAIA